MGTLTKRVASLLVTDNSASGVPDAFALYTELRCHGSPAPPGGPDHSGDNFLPRSSGGSLCSIQGVLATLLARAGFFSQAAHW